MHTRVRRRLRTWGGVLVAIGGGVLAGSLVAGLIADAGHARAQEELRLERPDGPGRSGRPLPAQTVAEDPVVRPPDHVASSRAPAAGEVFGSLWFERDGQRILHARALVVLHGVDESVLARGPGRYPGSARAGAPGNLAIAGHRTTHGGPFDGLSDLRDGDTIHVRDADGVEWVHQYRETRIVDPTEVWVVGADPLGTGRPTLTLTTCHPRHSARQRLVVFGDLDGPVGAPSGD